MNTKTVHLIFFENGVIGAQYGHSEGDALKEYLKDHPDHITFDLHDIKSVEDMALYQWNNLLAKIG